MTSGFATGKNKRREGVIVWVSILSCEQDDDDNDCQIIRKWRRQCNGVLQMKSILVREREKWLKKREKRRVDDGEGRQRQWRDGGGVGRVR